MNFRALCILSLLLGVGAVFSAFTFEPEAEPEKVKIPASPAKAEERRGLEAGYWALEPNSNPAELRGVVSEEQDDNRMLRMVYKGGAADKSAVKKMTGLAATDTGKLHTWIYSADDDAPSVSFALITGTAYNWQETQTIKLKKGWNEISIDLAAKTWKSKDSEWKNDAALAGREELHAIAFNVYNGQASGTVYLDALQIDHTGDTAEIETQIQKLADPAARDEAAKEIAKGGRAAIECLNVFVETSKDKDAVAKAIGILEHLSARPKPAE